MELGGKPLAATHPVSRAGPLPVILGSFCVLRLTAVCPVHVGRWLLNVVVER